MLLTRTTPMFALTWATCVDGFVLDEIKPPKKRGRASRTMVGGEAPTGPVIRAKSNRFRPSEPLRIEALYRVLLRHEPDANEMLSFVNAHGFLFDTGEDGDNYYETADAVLAFRSNVQNLVDRIEERHWWSVAKYLDEHKVARLSMSFIPPKMEDPGDDLDAFGRLQFQCSTLADAIIAQAVADATIGAQHRTCLNPQCLAFFPVQQTGPLAGRKRSDAKYCSIRCRNRHGYLKKLAAEKEAIK